MITKKQNLFFNYIILGFFILLTGCGSDPVQKDLINYINVQVQSFVPLESKLMSEYGSVSGDNFKDDLTLYTALQSSIRPTCIKITDILENKISPKTPEVSALHELYIESYNIQCNAFLYFESALEKGDSALVVKANEGLNRARKLQRQWLSKLTELKKKYNVLTK